MSFEASYAGAGLWTGFGAVGAGTFGLGMAPGFGGRGPSWALTINSNVFLVTPLPVLRPRFLHSLRSCTMLVPVFTLLFGLGGGGGSFLACFFFWIPVGLDDDGFGLRPGGGGDGDGVFFAALSGCFFVGCSGLGAPLRVEFLC